MRASRTVCEGILSHVRGCLLVIINCPANQISKTSCITFMGGGCQNNLPGTHPLQPLPTCRLAGCLPRVQRKGGMIVSVPRGRHAAHPASCLALLPPATCHSPYRTTLPSTSDPCASQCMPSELRMTSARVPTELRIRANSGRIRTTPSELRANPNGKEGLRASCERVSSELRASGATSNGPRGWYVGVTTRDPNTLDESSQQHCTSEHASP